MKKYYLLAAAALTLAACSSSDEAADNWNNEIRLSSGLSVQTVSRAATTNYAKVFDGGEKIDVYISEAVDADKTATTTYGTLTYTTVATASTEAISNTLTLTTGSQPYWPASGNGVNIYAIYPSGTASGDYFSVAKDQSTDATNGDANYKTSDLMYAKASSERTSSAVNLAFGHLLSKITVTLTSGEGTPSLDGAKVEILNVYPMATLNADATGASASVATKVTSSSGPMEATLPVSPEDITVFTASSTTTSGSCIVPPQTLNKQDSEAGNARRFIKVTLKNGGELYSGDITKDNSTLGDIEMKSSYEYKYEIKVNLTKLDVTSSIGTWDDGGNGSGSATME